MLSRSSLSRPSHEALRWLRDNETARGRAVHTPSNRKRCLTATACPWLLSEGRRRVPTRPRRREALDPPVPLLAAECGLMPGLGLGAGATDPIRTSWRVRPRVRARSGTVSPVPAQIARLALRTSPEGPPEPRPRDDRAEDRPDRQPAQEVRGRLLVVHACRPGFGPRTATTVTIAMPSHATIDAPTRL